MDVNETEYILTIPLFEGVDRVKLSAILSGCKVKEFDFDQYIFRHGEFGDECGIILSGRVKVEKTGKFSKSHNCDFNLEAGSLFGVLAILTGARRVADVKAFTQSVKILFIHRQTLLELTNVFIPVKERVDSLYSKRVLYSSIRSLPLFSSISSTLLNELITKASITTFLKNDTVYSCGDKADSLHIIRYGIVKIYETTKYGKERVLAIIKEGQYFGEKALLSDGNYTMSTTAVACSGTEIIKISVHDFQQVLKENPNIRDDITSVIKKREEKDAQVRTDNYMQKTLTSVIDAGIVQSSSIILIDATKCIHCDECEKACAALHDNHSRLTRKGFKLNNFLLIPTSCRLCDDPACISNCPTDSIFRDFTGEIYHNDTCIGCGTCAANCPYGNITISTLPEIKDHKDKDVKGISGSSNVRKKAVTCDKCKGYPFFACVYNCATGAARRVNPSEFFSEITTIG